MEKNRRVSSGKLKFLAQIFMPYVWGMKRFLTSAFAMLSLLIGSRTEGSGRRMKEVACPTCTVHLQVFTASPLFYSPDFFLLKY